MKTDINHVQIVIIGGGQAGMSAAYCLQQRGITDQVIFEKNRLGHSWREERWDNFCLVTPNFQCRLPDHPYDGNDPQGFMPKDEIVDYVVRFADKVKAPIYEGVEVISVIKEDGVFKVITSIGEWQCDDVICAIGSFHTPFKPKGAENIPQSIEQLYATEYKNPKQIPEGEIAIVGSGQSGCQIAEDLHLVDRKVHLFLGNAPRSPRKYRGRDVVAWLEEMGYYKKTFAEHPDKSKALSSTNHYLTGRDGGREIDLRKFAQEGMKIYGYLDEISNEGFIAKPNCKEKLDSADRSYVGIRERIDKYIADKQIDAPVEAPYSPCWEPDDATTELDFKKSNITSIIWCIGFRPNFSFIDIEVFNMRGFPQHDRGVTAVPGLYFIGLPWLHTWGSARFSGIAEDAAYIAKRIDIAIKSHAIGEYAFA